VGSKDFNGRQAGIQKQTKLLETQERLGRAEKMPQWLVLRLYYYFLVCSFEEEKYTYVLIQN
jgi:hypothetical protein